ncbi:TetR/AcrR family transcriptional regulator [Actinacidiphila acididurans]|uniref:TetR/AcrR family transcriptional regulator n=1 Tax=Actinacidiphila acididurans TaxID=2784346 RepID=UPI0027DC2BBF|nr:TetR/AcrR family transcriptional regulator [Actinacidiphila acididurans]
MRAEERRALVLRVAVTEFGLRGYEATSTASIARRVGVSQPYLFRLFRSKKHLFTATADFSLAEMCRLMEDAAKGVDHGERLAGCVRTFLRPGSAHRDLLRFQLALYGAAGDPDVAVVARRHYETLWRRVSKATGAPDENVHGFFQELSLTIVRALLDE